MDGPRLEDLLRLRRELDKRTINLVATELRVPPEVLEACKGYYRYYSTDGTAKKKSYPLSLTRELEEYAIDVLRKLYGIKYFSLRFHSATIANWLVSLFLGERGLAHPLTYAGHPSHYAFGDVKELPFDPFSFEYTISERADRAFIGNSAMIMLPTVKKEERSPIVFDASQIIGILSSSQLANIPFDIIVASTHKTYPALQAAFVGFRDRSMWESFEDFVEGRYIEGIKAGKIAAIVAGGEWLLENGKEYRRKVKEYATSLAEALVDRGIGVMEFKVGYTETHTVLLEEDILDPLTNHKIKASNVRWGDREVTRLGVQDVVMAEMLGEFSIDPVDLAERIARSVR